MWCGVMCCVVMRYVVVRCDMVWCDVLCYGVMRYVVVWCDVVWCDVLGCYTVCCGEV